MLRRAFPLLPLAAGTLAAWLFASGLGQLLGGSLAPFDPASLAVAQPPLPLVSTPARHLHVLAVDEPAPPAPSAPPPGPRADRCPGPARLVVAAVDPGAPARSLAVVALGGDKPLIREGSRLDGRRVTRITASRVYLDDDAERCWISTAAAPPVAAASTSAPPRVAARPDPLRPLIERVRRVDAHTLEVDRAVLDAMMEQQIELLRDLRAAPERAGDRVVGLKLGPIKPGSLAEHVGLRAGDRLVSINRYDLTDPGQLLKAYAKLRLAPSLTLALVRDGAPTSIDLLVR
jgi:type II secretion system protein C